jgi:hypothetical protein
VRKCGTGLVSSFNDSGEVKVSSPITRQRSRWLRWALVTAANVALQHRNPFARRYHRLHRSKKPNAAKAAIAHSLARCVYGVLKHGCPYREDRWGRQVGVLEQEARAGALGPPRPRSDRDQLPNNLIGTRVTWLTRRDDGDRADSENSLAEQESNTHGAVPRARQAAESERLPAHRALQKGGPTITWNDPIR